MSNGLTNDGRGNETAGSIWPVVTIVVGVVALALAGWDAALASQNRHLRDRVDKLEKTVTDIENKDKAEAAAAQAARRKAARTAAAAAGASTPGTDAKAPEKAAGNK
jgi:hypothetical protein